MTTLSAEGRKALLPASSSSPGVILLSTRLEFKRDSNASPNPRPSKSKGRKRKDVPDDTTGAAPLSTMSSVAGYTVSITVIHISKDGDTETLECFGTVEVSGDAVESAVDEQGRVTILRSNGELESLTIHYENDLLSLTPSTRLLLAPALRSLQPTSTALLALPSSTPSPLLLLATVSSTPSPTIETLILDLRFRTVLASNSSPVPASVVPNSPLTPANCRLHGSFSEPEHVFLSLSGPSRLLVQGLPITVPEQGATAALALGGLGIAGLKRKWVGAGPTTPDEELEAVADTPVDVLHPDAGKKRKAWVEGETQRRAELAHSLVDRWRTAGKTWTSEAVVSAENDWDEWRTEEKKWWAVESRARDERKAERLTLELEEAALEEKKRTQPTAGLKKRQRKEKARKERKADLLIKIKMAQLDEKYRGEAVDPPIPGSFARALVRFLLRSEERDPKTTQGIYPRKIVAYLLTRGLVADGMVHGGVVNALSKAQDWSNLHHAFQYMYDIPENAFASVLRSVLVAPNGPLPEILATIVAQPFSASALRPALATELGIGDVVRIVELLDRWMAKWIDKSFVGEGQGEVAGILGSEGKIKIGQGSGRKAPSMESIVVFLEVLLDAHFVSLLHHTPSHPLLSSLHKHSATHLSIGTSLLSLHAPLSAFTGETKPKMKKRKPKVKGMQKEEMKPKEIKKDMMSSMQDGSSRRKQMFEDSLKVGDYTIERFDI